MDLLAEADGEPVSVAAIATETGKTRANVVHLLRRLMDEILVRKVSHGKYVAAGRGGEREANDDPD